jgi:PIN domain nuclease of toxin-antitoxin system
MKTNSLAREKSGMPSVLETWVLDTHIWIRLLNGDPAFDKARFQEGIFERSRSGTLRVASISLWETAMLCAKGRLKLVMPVNEWLDKAIHMPGLAVIPIDQRIASDSCFLPGSFHGDPADRIITATARVLDAELITLDGAILEYAKEGWVRAHGVD